MEPETVIYTDGHDVKVTSSKLVVKKHEYLLKGITAFRLLIIRANKVIPGFLVLLGIVAVILGLLEVFPASAADSVEVSNQVFSTNDLIAIAGGFLFIIALLWMIVTQDKYAVEITTAEGNKNVLVSSKRDYVNQVLDALAVATTPVA